MYTSCLSLCKDHLTRVMIGGGGIKSGKKREEEVDMALMLCLCVIRRKSLKLHRFSFCSVMLRRDASLLLLFFPYALRMHSNCKMFKCKVHSVPRCPLCPTGLRRRVCQVSIVSSYTVQQCVSVAVSVRIFKISGKEKKIVIFIYFFFQIALLITSQTLLPHTHNKGESKLLLGAPLLTNSMPQWMASHT